MTFSNIRTVRIEWGDCDPAGIIFYPRYFNIFDASTAALFERALGMSTIQYFKAFACAGHPLLRTRAKFISPTRYGDDVSVQSRISFGETTFDIEHRLSRGDALCVEGSETRAWLARDASGQLTSRPVPQAVRDRFGF